MSPYHERRLLLVMTALLAGCAGAPTDTTVATARPLLPDTALKLTKDFSITLEKMVVWGGTAAVAYLILDPLAPNWEIEEATFPDDHVHLALRMKRIYSGGAGEARQAFQQRAKELMRRGGYDGYTILEYREGLDSSILGSQRTGQGVIRLTRRVG